MKKTLLIILIFFISVFSLFASPELWLGVGMSSGRDYMGGSSKMNIKSNEEIKANSLYKKGEFGFLNEIGPKLELEFFPFDSFRLGIYGSDTVNFIISVDGDGYKSRHWDFKNIAEAGLAYNQMFSSNAGIYLNAGFYYGTYSIATSNAKNNREKPNKISFSEYGFAADFGLLAMMKNSYFKFGFNYKQGLSQKENGRSLDLGLLIGYKF